MSNNKNIVYNINWIYFWNNLIDGPSFIVYFLRIEYKHQNRNLQHVKIFWKLEKWVGLKNGAIWQEDITGTDWILLVWWPRGHRAGQSWNLQNSSAFLIQKSTKITLAYCCVIHECFSKFNALPLKYYKVTPAQCFPKSLLRTNFLNDVTAAPFSVFFTAGSWEKTTKNGAAVTALRTFICSNDFSKFQVLTL